MYFYQTKAKIDAKEIQGNRSVNPLTLTYVFSLNLCASLVEEIQLLAIKPTA